VSFGVPAVIGEGTVPAASPDGMFILESPLGFGLGHFIFLLVQQHPLGVHLICMSILKQTFPCQIDNYCWVLPKQLSYESSEQHELFWGILLQCMVRMQGYLTTNCLIHFSSIASGLAS
jgi:hypothetical protein